MGSLGISFDKCRYCCIYLYVYGALICFTLRSVVKSYFYSHVFKSLVIRLTSLTPILFCGAGGQCVCFVFVAVDVVFRFGVCYIRYFVICF
jgi:hypothetical protein